MLNFKLGVQSVVASKGVIGNPRSRRLCPPPRKKWPKSAIFGKILDFCPLRNAFCPSMPTKNKQTNKQKEKFWFRHCMGTVLPLSINTSLFCKHEVTYNVFIKRYIVFNKLFKMQCKLEECSYFSQVHVLCLLRIPKYYQDWSVSVVVISVRLHVDFRRSGITGSGKSRVKIMYINVFIVYLIIVCVKGLHHYYIHAP